MISIRHHLPGYQILLQYLDEDGCLRLGSEVCRRLEEIAPELPFWEIRAGDEGIESDLNEVTIQTVYHLGRLDGSRLASMLPAGASPRSTMRRVVSLCHSLVPRAGEYLDLYRGVTRHYVAGVWQEMSLRIAPSLRSGTGASPIEGLTERFRDARGEEIEAEIEAEQMQFIPVWEIKEPGDVPDAMIERMTLRAARIATLTDLANQKAREAVLERIACVLPGIECTDKCLETLYLVTRSAIRREIKCEWTPEDSFLLRQLAYPVRKHQLQSALVVRRSNAEAIRVSRTGNEHNMQMAVGVGH